MLVYLQPFLTKDFIDATSMHRKSLGDDISHGEGAYLRGRFCVAACSGVAQTVYYLCLWAFSSVLSFGSLGLNKTLERFSEESGSLAIAAMTSVGIASASVVYLSAAEVLTARISVRADSHFKALIDHHIESFSEEISLVRYRACARAAGRGQEALPERFYDPAAAEMSKDRQRLTVECSQAYKKGFPDKYLAYAEAYRQLRLQGIQHSRRLKELPVSRKEIDRHLVYRISLLAEEGMADLYNHCLNTWADRIRSWGQKFDREIYSRHCLKLFEKKKANKRVQHLVRDVKEAENKDKAYNEAESELKAFFSEMRGHVSALDRPWPWVRVWRAFYPFISSWKAIQAVDRFFDPAIHTVVG